MLPPALGTSATVMAEECIPEEARKDRGTQIALIKPRMSAREIETAHGDERGKRWGPPLHPSFAVLAVCVKSPDFCLLS